MITKNKLLCMLLFIALVVGMVTTGCDNSASSFPEQPLENEKETQDTEEPDEKKAVLYFTNNEADKLVKEKREINASEEEMEKAILAELIKGPEDLGHERTIPEDVKVLGVTVEGGVASANFSEEIRSSHWGGSTGEIITVYSIVNTLAELSYVQQVRFLVEGQEIETLLGHMDLTENVHPDWEMVK